MGTLSFEPLLPPALWLALAVAAGVLLFWHACQRPATMSRRSWAAALALVSAGMALVLGILLNPTWVRPIAPPQGKPLVSVLVDLRPSMNTPDAPGQKTRLAAAGELAGALAKRCGDEFEVRVEGFADGLRPLSPQNFSQEKAAGQMTDLAKAIVGAAPSQRPQGQAIVLLSDGGHNAPGGVGPVLAAARHARAMAAPVFTWTLGSAAGTKNFALQARRPQEIAFVGQTLSIDADVVSRGIDGQNVPVSLLRDGQEIARKTVVLSTAGPQEVGFEVKEDKPGLYQYELQAQAPPGEVRAARNVDFVQLRVVDEPIRILLLEGKPYWDAKFLLRTLASDAAVELHSVVKLAPGRLLCRTIVRAGPVATPSQEQGAPPQPWHIEQDAARILGAADSLRNYQIVVLGREAEEFLSDAGVANLRNWVARDEGALVCYRGSPVTQVNQPLEPLMPVRWSPGPEEHFRLQVTPLGQNLPWLGREDALAHLPTLATDRRAEVRGPLAVVLARGDLAQEPAVTYQPYGSGRVVVIEGQGMWRWAFLGPEDQASAQWYPDLWHSLLRWLVSNAGLLPGQNFSLRCDKVVFASGQSAWATLLVRSETALSAAPAVELVREGQTSAEPLNLLESADDPGAFRIALGAKLPPGRYQVRLIGAAQDDPAGHAVFQVRDVAEEQLDIAAQPELMKRIAEESGGAAIDGDSVDRIAARLHDQIAQGRLLRVERRMAWDRWWVLAGILGVWTAAWAVRRRGELPGGISAAAAFAARPRWRTPAELILLAAVLTAVALLAPRIAPAQWASTLLSVQPGDAKVICGGALEIKASTNGRPVDNVDLVLQWPHTPQEVLPMFPEPDGTWRASLTNVVLSGQYFVRARGARSASFNIDVLPVPQIEDVGLVIRPPAYTHLPEYRGAVPQGGIAALPGTRVEVLVTSKGPLSGGTLEVPGAAPQGLVPTGPHANQVAGAFTVVAAGKIRISVRDECGQDSAEAFSAAVTLLRDEPPVVRILEPKTFALATPDATIPLRLAAEDDYGISSLQWFRSLNESAALPVEFPIDAQQPPRLTATGQLPLDGYGLVPGDVIKLYAHVEDNDPAGAKGADSSVVIIRIVSQEDLARLSLAQAGLEKLHRPRLYGRLPQGEQGLKLGSPLEAKGAAPPQYQKRVDEYFRRLADDMEQP